MKVKAVLCPRCRDTIYSRAHYDFRYCSCKATFVDGGFEYMRIGYKEGFVPITFQLIVQATKKELYDDWNEKKDKHGRIPEEPFVLHHKAEKPKRRKK